MWLLGLRVVSFDAHFDRTDLDRTTPADVLAELVGGRDEGVDAE